MTTPLPPFQKKGIQTKSATKEDLHVLMYPAKFGSIVTACYKEDVQEIWLIRDWTSKNAFSWDPSLWRTQLEIETGLNDSKSFEPSSKFQRRFLRNYSNCEKNNCWTLFEGGQIQIKSTTQEGLTALKYAAKFCSNRHCNLNKMVRTTDVQGYFT